MARLSVNALLGELRGSVDRLVVRKIGGQYFIGRKPEPQRKRRPTPAQVAHRDRFRHASAYAQAVQRNPALHAFYASLAAARHVPVRALAISD